MTRESTQFLLEDDLDVPVRFRDSNDAPSLSKRLWKPHPPRVRNGRKNSIRDGLHRRRIKRTPGTKISLAR